MTWQARLLTSVGVIVATMAIAVRPGEAHKPITSKFTYNDDVFPIFRDKCGRCHVAGGIAPMSLMTYEDAFPWAESIRIELIASHMPPWNAQRDVGAFKHADLLTATELDTILTWATGGNPKGRLGEQVPKVTLTNAWAAGPPDLTFALPEVAMPADKMEETREFTVPTGTHAARWVRAADLLPGTPSVVRSAVIAIKGTNAAFGPEHVLRRWLPGQDVETADHDGAAFELPPDAVLSVQVHYKKTWQAEGQSPTDHSTIGLYFAADRSPHDDLVVVPVAAARGNVADQHALTFERTIDREVRALALTPDNVPPNITIAASATLPDGSRLPLIRIHSREDWNRRYWFAQPIVMPAGTKIEVRADFEDPAHLASEAFGGFGAPAPVAQTPNDSIGFSLDVTTPGSATPPG